MQKIIHLSKRDLNIFKIHYQKYHRNSYLSPHNGQNSQFAKLSVLDSTIQATEIRENFKGNYECHPNILKLTDVKNLHKILVNI